MAVMADSCVLLDIFAQDPQWFDWASEAIAQAADVGPIIINPVIYAEISIRFDRVEDLDDELPDSIFEYRPIPKEAAFLAGKSFITYRRRGGNKTSPLPDFFIGAHAAVQQVPLITRDTKRYREYFPTVQLIAPL